MKTVSSTLLCDTCTKSNVCKFKDDFVQFNNNILSQHCHDVFKVKTECIYYSQIFLSTFGYACTPPSLDPTKVTCK